MRLGHNIGWNRADALPAPMPVFAPLDEVVAFGVMLGLSMEDDVVPVDAAIGSSGEGSEAPAAIRMFDVFCDVDALGLDWDCHTVLRDGNVDSIADSKWVFLL